MKRFVCYIGCAALVFKLMYGAAWAAGATAGDTAAPENGGAAVSAETASAAVSAVRDTLPGTAAAAVSAGTAAAVGGESIVYRVRDLTAAASGGDEGSGEMGSGETGSGDTGSEGETPEPIIRSDNELAKLALLPFIVDKVFAGEALDGDLTGFLSRVYPTAGEGTLKTLESGIRFFVSWKRKYDYAVARLKHNIKAAGILPKDAPIVAEDGEFAPEETDLRKQSAAGEYQVRYRPYKYLEYDPGALGEPVRRRDKNYISPEDLNTDEMVLALLELDFGGFWRALRKMPSYSDGAGEKPVEAGGGVKARLLLDTARPGDKETIRGVAEIYVPDGMYVSGDLLNPENRAAFVLREDGGSGGSATGSSSSATGNSGSATGSGSSITGMAAAAVNGTAVASEKIVTSAPTAGSAAALLADDEPENMSLSSKIIVFTTIFAVLTFGISLFGYPELATFIFNRFIASVLFIGAFVIVRRFISDLLRRSIVFWIKTFKLRKQLLSKADFLMTLLVTPLLVLFLIYSLLTLWGMPGAFMLQAVKKLVFGFKVGGINISLISIVTGLLVFLISLTLVKMMKNRLSNNLLNRINMDEGIKHSLISGFSFTGFIISAILAIVAMGVDLSNLAVIAGALSVGIGFGLQDVIKNLVSGIILLFERPFKVGDWVLIGGEEGKIKQINIRSTEVETFNKASVIIPNATLISSSLTNLTHGNNWQRQTIAVGVSYDSDAEQVTKLLLECARSCKKVMKVPAPYVLFKNFGESSLDFELRIYVSDIWSGWSAGSDVRYEILRRFREANINIAYPQIVVHQGSEDTSVKGWQTNV